MDVSVIEYMCANVCVVWKRQTDEVMLNYCINFQTYPFSCLLFERLLFLLLFQSLSHLHNTCSLMEGGREGGMDEGREEEMKARFVLLHYHYQTAQAIP